MKKNIDDSALSARERYINRLGEFEKYYRTLIVFTFIAVGVGAVVAIFANLFVGAALAVFSAAVYVYFSADEARSALGIRYSNTDGHIVMTRLFCVLGDTVIIPARFIYADVRAIGDGALASKKNAELCALYIPLTVEKIGKDIFGAHHLPKIFYEGSREQWERISKQTDLDGCEICFECDYPTLPPKEKKHKRNKRGEVAQ